MKHTLAIALATGLLFSCQSPTPETRDVPLLEAFAQVQPVPASSVQHGHALAAEASLDLTLAAISELESAEEEQILRGLLHSLELRTRIALDNLANIDTPGFKRRVALLRATAPETIPVGPNSLPAQFGTGVVLVGTEPVMHQGEVKITSRELDLAIQGHGFFEVLLPDGRSAYTRSGLFHRDVPGNLVHRGSCVMSQSGELVPAVKVPTGALEISIGQNGDVSARVNKGVCTIAKVSLVTFPNPAALEAMSGDLWIETQASGPPTRATPGSEFAGTIMQGALEGSNVNLLDELRDLSEIRRRARALRELLSR